MKIYIKKVLKVRKSGTVTMGKPGSRHNTGSKSQAVNRKNRKGKKENLFRRQYKI